MDRSKVRYHFEAPNKVVAEISGCKFDAFDYCDKHFFKPTSSAYEIWCTKTDERYTMPNYFEATAYCSDEDKFNWETGKKIAFNKLCDKYTTSLTKHVNNLMFTLYQSFRGWMFYAFDRAEKMAKEYDKKESIE